MSGRIKLVQYSDIKPVRIALDQEHWIDGRVAIGKEDGAPHFCMRVFEVSPGGSSPRHRHEWEHEIFVHAGEGEALLGGEWRPLKAESVVFVPGGEEHQLRNTGAGKLVFVCLIPAGAPEL